MPKLKEIRAIQGKVQIVLFANDGLTDLEVIDLDLGSARFYLQQLADALKVNEDLAALRRDREATALRRQQQQKKQELLDIAEKLRALGVPSEEPEAEPDPFFGWTRVAAAIKEFGVPA